MEPSRQSSLNTLNTASRYSTSGPREVHPRSSGCVGRTLTYGLILLVGLACGAIAMLLVVIALPSQRQPAQPTQVPQNESLVLQISASYVSQLVQKNLNGLGLPGTPRNVRVAITHNGPIVISGEDEVQVLGVNATRPFTVQLQPYTQACRLQMRVLSANLGGLPVTVLASSFEEQINQQLQLQSNSLPAGFTYCVSGARTENQELVVTYAATPS